MDRRTLMAIVLSLSVFLIFNHYYSSKLPKKPVEENISSRAVPVRTVPVRVGKEKQEEYVYKEEEKKPLVKEKEVIVETDLVKIVLGGSSGTIKSYKIKEYKEAEVKQNAIALNNQRIKQLSGQLAKATSEEQRERLSYQKEEAEYINARLISRERQGELKTPQDIELVSFANYYTQTYPLQTYFQAKGEMSVINNFKCDSTRLLLSKGKLEGYVRFVSHLKDGSTIIKKILFRNDGYLIGVNLELINNTDKNIEQTSFLISTGTGLRLMEEQSSGRGGGVGLQSVSYINDKVIKKPFSRGEKDKDVTQSYIGRIWWTALSTKYFLNALIPVEPASKVVIKKNKLNVLQNCVEAVIPDVRPNQSFSYSINCYLGPKDVDRLAKQEVNLEALADFGFFGNLFRIVHILKFLHKITGNYGVAIILLTILMSIVLFPLTIKSHKSMRAMQELQPQISALKNKYKDNAQKINKETMALYKKNKVNPLGGCLPMMLQMPLFFALFTTLRNAIELKGTCFIPGWIPDLSLPDTVFYLGALMDKPGMYPLNILPILMSITTVLQQKFTTQSADPKQAKMMLFMPVFMLFIFYNFPSGLVLYWLTNNILSIAQQVLIRKKH
ncbi:MAG: membrane protein insertase YidC [bacterium]|nr:membrane protein insertase YidC [bacterium]